MTVADLLADLLLDGVVFVSSIFVTHHVHGPYLADAWKLQLDWAQ